jgi:hypothetical protein
MMDSAQAGPNASAHRRLPKPWRIRFGRTATGQACEWSRMLGLRPTALPAQTLRFVPVVSASLVPVRVAVRNQPLVSSQRIL